MIPAMSSGPIRPCMKSPSSQTRAMTRTMRRMSPSMAPADPMSIPKKVANAFAMSSKAVMSASDREHHHHHEARQHRRSSPCDSGLFVLPAREVRPEEHERYRSDDRDYHRDLDRDVRPPVLSLWA